MDTIDTKPIGVLLREWRNRRRLSQLDLACAADISTRHISFVETSRSRPSRDMVLHLSEILEVPLRARNILLGAAGYAPVYSERDLGKTDMQEVREAVQQVLTAHEPYPAFAVDRHWNMVMANNAVGALTAGVAPHLLSPPINVLRASLHPDGLASQIVNYHEWRAHILERLHQQVAASADPVLAQLADELTSYPSPRNAQHVQMTKKGFASVAMPLRVKMDDGTILSFISTITMFGTPIDVTLSELAIEALFPADDVTKAALQG